MALPIVPEGTNTAASLPTAAAARSSSAITVGSSPQTSSPTSAVAITRRIASVGRVKVSERNSYMGGDSIEVTRPRCRLARPCC